MARLYTIHIHAQKYQQQNYIRWKINRLPAADPRIRRPVAVVRSPRTRGGLFVRLSFKARGKGNQLFYNGGRTNKPNGQTNQPLMERKHDRLKNWPIACAGAASSSLFTTGSDRFHDNPISWQFEIPSFSGLTCFTCFYFFTRPCGSVAGRAVLTYLTKHFSSWDAQVHR